MITEQKYVVSSLELHLFFGRIMKEHALFLEAGFTPQNADFSKKADYYKQQFEVVLYNAVHLGNGIISEASLLSKEIVTDYTLICEEQTENFTSIPINKEITEMQMKMYGSNNPSISPRLVSQVNQLNDYASELLEGLIEFKTRILENVLSCKMFTMNYPLLIQHILNEANLYKKYLKSLASGKELDETVKEQELFWDKIMMEHALFIRGLLDPSENSLIQAADEFANKYAELLMKSREASTMSFSMITHSTLEETIKYRDFKGAGAKGITECKIRGIILPLLADHVLREANHYINLLKKFSI